MSQNFVACDRGQVFLMPPSLTDWVPDDHLVWTVLGAVEQMSLDAFYGVYRANGQNRARLSPFRPALRASLHNDSRITQASPVVSSSP